MAYDRKNPYLSAILERRCLNGPGSQKETQHVVLDLGDSGIEYVVGDSFGVLPQHSDELVERTLKALRATGDEVVNDRVSGQPCTLGELVKSKRNITQLQRKAIQILAPASAQLATLLAPEHLAEQRAFLAEHQLWDAVNGTPVDFQVLADALPPLLPRLFSVASSQKAVGNKVHLTVSLVKYTTSDIERFGVASWYLCKEAPVEQKCIPTYLQSAAGFRMPADGGRPLIMIGPGTGVAPFRAFMQEREVLGAKGKNWLFFGDWNEATDYLYREDFVRWQKMGMLRCDLAFSRDQAHKIYVQDRMRERAAEIWAWIQEGANIYVCGDAEAMAPAVEATFFEICQQHGSMDKDTAIAFVKALRKDQRYQKDCY